MDADTSSGSASLALSQQPVTSEQCSEANRVSPVPPPLSPPHTTVTVASTMEGNSSTSDSSCEDSGGEDSSGEEFLNTSALEIKDASDLSGYKLDDLVWAKSGTAPFWPAMVSHPFKKKMRFLKVVYLSENDKQERIPFKIKDAARVCRFAVNQQEHLAYGESNVKSGMLTSFGEAYRKAEEISRRKMYRDHGDKGTSSVESAASSQADLAAAPPTTADVAVAAGDDRIIAPGAALRHQETATAAEELSLKQHNPKCTDTDALKLKKAQANRPILIEDVPANRGNMDSPPKRPPIRRRPEPVAGPSSMRAARSSPLKTGLSTDTVRTDCGWSVTMATPADRRCADEDTHSESAELQPPPKRRLDVDQGRPTAATSRPPRKRASPRRKTGEKPSIFILSDSSDEDEEQPGTSDASQNRFSLSILEPQPKRRLDFSQENPTASRTAPDIQHSTTRSSPERGSPRRKTGERTSPSNTAMATDDLSDSNDDDDDEEQPGTPDPSQNKLTTYRKGEVVWCRREDLELFWPAKVIRPYDELQDCVTTRFFCHGKSKVYIKNVTKICQHAVHRNRHRSLAKSELSGCELKKFKNAYSKAEESYKNADRVTQGDLAAMATSLSRLQSKVNCLETELEDQANRLSRTESKPAVSVKSREECQGETCTEMMSKVALRQEASNSELRAFCIILWQACSHTFFKLQADLDKVNAKCKEMEETNSELEKKCTEMEEKSWEMDGWNADLEEKNLELLKKCSGQEAQRTSLLHEVDEKHAALEEKAYLSQNRFVLHGVEEEEGEGLLGDTLSRISLNAMDVVCASRIGSRAQCKTSNGSGPEERLAGTDGGKQRPRPVLLELTLRGRSQLLKLRRNIQYKGRKVRVQEYMSCEELARRRSNWHVYKLLRDKQIPCSLPRSRILDNKGRPMSQKQICSLLLQPAPAT